MSREGRFHTSNYTQLKLPIIYRIITWTEMWSTKNLYLHVKRKKEFHFK